MLLPLTLRLSSALPYCPPTCIPPTAALLPPCPPATAGLLVLCCRARIGCEELSAELLLTMLWLMESCESQCECLSMA